ncbi:MAG: Ig-like domain-containing protein [Treponema sp.]|nr:Ig-like domain-containing protein [Candidatus Treponema equifaecale]
MKKLCKLFLSLFLTAGIIGTTFVSCSDGSDSSGGNEKPPVEKDETTVNKTVSSVSITPSVLNLVVGDEPVKLSAVVNGTNLSDSDKEVTWTSQDEKVVKVAEDGTVTVIAKGSTRVVATSKKDTTKSNHCMVTIEDSNVSKVLYNFDYSSLGSLSDGTNALVNKTAKFYDDAVYCYYNGSGSSMRIRTAGGINTGINYNGENTSTKTGNVGDAVAETGGFYCGIDLSKVSVALPDEVTVSFKCWTTGSSKATSDNGIAYLVDASTGKAIVVAKDLKMTAASDPFTITAKVSKTANVRVFFSRNGNGGGGFDISEIKVIDENTAGEAVVRPASITLSKTSVSLAITDDDLAPAETLTATVLPANVTSGYGTVTWTSSNESVATVSGGVVTAKGAGSATITASTSNGKSVICTVEVSSSVSAKYILASDKPDGWAGTQSTTGGYGATAANIYTVKNYKEFTAALKAGSTKKIIYVSGTIDLNGNQSAYDYIKAAGLDSKYSSYEDYRTKFLKTCIKDTVSTLAADQSKLHKAQAAQAIIAIPSNTTILGLGTDAGFSGGNLSVSNATNVVIRNVKIWDSLDFFPPWYQNNENNFNADMDCITISGSTNVWIDHCTIGDTAHTYEKFDTPAGNLDWVNYDALCDVVNGSNYVTISYNKFMNDDKVGLVGNGDSKTSDKGKLKTTFHHNLYDNVGQRLPRVRFGQVHIFNQYYKKVSSYCIGLGKECQVVSENNYFGGSFNAYSEMTNPRYLTQSGNEFKSARTTSPSVSGEADWSPSSVSEYKYILDSATDIPVIVENNAGAGVWVVKK